jgi:aryl-alcohol dehydrogenase-like predicted oxidoreductase
VFAHRYDYETPLEETCMAFHWLIENGKAFYWATSEWPADRITKALEICERKNLHKPIAE